MDAWPDYAGCTLLLVVTVPTATVGSIGGSGTWGARFPEDLGRPEVSVLELVEPIATPYGVSCPLKLLDVGGQRVLRVAMHGWHRDEHGESVPTWTCALQVAWLFQEAGVEWVLVDGSVGGIQRPDEPGAPLPPWSVVITDDFIQYWLPPTPGRLIHTTGFAGWASRSAPDCADTCLRPLTPGAPHRVRRRGLCCTPPGRFETPAEIRMMAGWGASVVGQTLGHEAPLMRQLGIHFGSLNIVSNYAEGNAEWVGEEPDAMADFYRACPYPVGNARRCHARALESGLGDCRCAEFRMPGLRAFPVEGA